MLSAVCSTETGVHVCCVNLNICLNTPYCVFLLDILKSLNLRIRGAPVQRTAHNMILQLPSADTTALCAETKGQVAPKSAPCFMFSILMTLKKVSLNVLTACESPIGTLHTHTPHPASAVLFSASPEEWAAENSGRVRGKGGEGSGERCQYACQ